MSDQSFVAQVSAPPKLDAAGRLFWNVPTSDINIVDAQQPDFDLQDSIDQHFARVTQHERDFRSLMDSADKIIASYQANLGRTLGRESASAASATFPADARSRLWLRAPESGEPVFRAAATAAKLPTELPSLGPGGEVRRRFRPHNSALPKEGVTVMKDWLYTHVDNPYPTQSEKDAMAEDTGLTIKQINNWFINARRRYLNKGKTAASSVYAPTKRPRPDDEDDMDDMDGEERLMRYELGVNDDF